MSYLIHGKSIDNLGYYLDFIVFVLKFHTHGVKCVLGSALDGRELIERVLPGGVTGQCKAVFSSFVGDGAPS